MMMFLPDVNLWLALAFNSHVHHTAAKGWFDRVGDSECAFCRMTQQGFLRLATNPKAFAADAVSMLDAWRMYDAFLADPRVVFLGEPVSLESVWRTETQNETFTPKVWNDAYLAAFAEATGIEMATFDKGFRRYTRVKSTILS